MVSVLIYLDFFFKSVFNPVIEDHYYFDKPHSIRIRSYYRFWLPPWYVQSFLKLLKCSFYTYTTGNCHIKRIQHRHFLFKCLCQARKEDRSCIFVKVSILSLSRIFILDFKLFRQRGIFVCFLFYYRNYVKLKCLIFKTYISPIWFPFNILDPIYIILDRIWRIWWLWCRTV